MSHSQRDVATLSFVIRTYNEAAYIRRLLDVLRRQEGELPKREVVVVDSGSTDATRSLAEAGGARLLRIRKEDFDYSKALNLGIENTSGSLIIVLSAHSIPCEASWLSRMLSHFCEPAVVGAYSRQIAWPDARWWEARRVRREFPETSAVFERGQSPESIPFSNAASCIRRDVWARHPFALPTGEDGEWATWAVRAGYRIVYDATCAVYHSHDETCRQAMRRAIEFEKANDIRLRRPRTSLLTLKQAAGRAFRDLREVCFRQVAPYPRTRLAWESLVRGYWFFRDFHRDAPFRTPVATRE